MKKLLIIALVFLFLTSCGPHRMSCGARGICDSPIKGKLNKNNT